MPIHHEQLNINETALHKTNTFSVISFCTCLIIQLYELTIQLNPQTLTAKRKGQQFKELCLTHECIRNAEKEEPEA